MKLSGARIFVRDFSEARTFYAEVLGLALKHDGARFGYCVFDTGELELIVEVVPNDAPAEDQALVGRFTGLSFAVADISTEHSRLLAAGVPFTGAPEKQFWGGWLATFKDPAGNELQLVQHPV